MLGKAIGLARAAGTASLGAAMLAAAVLAPHGASAATIRTIDFEASDLTTTGGDLFTTLGISPVTTATGSFSFDPMAPPFSGPTTFNAGTSLEFSFARRPYVSFSVNLGSLTLTGDPSGPVDDIVVVQDGIGSLRADAVRVVSSVGQSLPSGAVLDSIAVAAVSVPTGVGPNLFSGTAVPDVAVLNAASIPGLRVNIFDPSGSRIAALFNTVTFSERLSVPAPAALPLMGLGLAMMAFLGWRRRFA